MSKKGTLNLDCIASDPTSTFLYGIANARSDTYTSTNEHTILVKSNPNPSNISNQDLQWEIVSKVDIKETAYRFPLINTVICAVSSEGEFSAFFYDGGLSAAGATLRPVGIRYDPKKADAGGARGGWSDILGSRSSLHWMDRSLLGQAFYIRDEGTSGRESVVLILADEFATVVRFGVVDEATNALQLAGIWRGTTDGTYERGALLDTFEKLQYHLWTGITPWMGYTSSRRIVYGDGHLYITRPISKILSNGQLVVNDTLIKYPFNKATDDPVPSAVLSMPDEHKFGEHLFSGFRRAAGGEDIPCLNSIGFEHIAIDTSRNSTTNNTAHLLSFNRFINHTRLSSRTHYRLSHFQSVGGRLPGQVPFAVIPMTDGLYGVPLSGAVNGDTSGDGTTELVGPVDVLVYGDASFNTWSRKDYPLLQYQEESSNVGLIVGVVAAVVLGVGAFWWRRKRMSRKQLEKSKQGMLEASLTGTDKEERRCEYVRQDSHVQTYQDEIQGLQLSTHPRPSYVVSVGDSRG